MLSSFLTNSYLLFLSSYHWPLDRYSYLCQFNKYTLCLKNVTILSCYNFDTHKLILIIFGRRRRKVAEKEKVSNQKTLFLTSPNLFFCTATRRRKPRNCICLLKYCMWFCQHKTHKNITCHSEPPLTVKTIDCVHHTRRRKGAKYPAVCFAHTRHLLSLSQCHLCVKNGSCSSSSWSGSQCTVLLRYFINIFLSQQMLVAAKCVVYDSIVFQQDTAPLQLLQCKTVNFLSPELWPCNSPERNSNVYKIWGLMQQHEYELWYQNWIN